MSKLKTNTIRHVDGSNDNITLDSSQNVTVEGKLKVGTASTSTRPISIYSASDAQIQFQGSGTGTGNGNADGFIVGNSGGVDATLWNYENGYLRFATNNSEKLRITSTGLILVNGDGVGGRIDATAGDSSIKISDGNGRSGIKVSDPGSGNSYEWELTTAGNLKAPSGKGIDFSANSNGPGTSVSELFHTYEEGYWVPTWNSNLTLESSYQNFQYTRVGRLVTVRGYVYPSSWSGSTAIYLTLPFASLNDADAANAGAGGCMFRYLDGCTGGLASYVGDNASAMYFYRCESGNSNYSALTTGNLQSGALWYFSHTYAAA